MSRGVAEGEVCEGYKRVQLGPKEVEIPKEWDTAPINEIAKKTKGKKPEKTTQEPSGDSVPYLTIEAAKGSPSRYTWPDKDQYCGPEDILIVWDGASSGEVIQGKEGVIGSTLAALRFDESSVDSDYAYYVLDNLYKTISSLGEGTGISHVPKEFTDIFSIPLPSVPEQRCIANVLSTVDDEIRQTEETIETVDTLRGGVLSNLISNGTASKSATKRRIGPKSYKIAEGWDLYGISELAADEQKAIRGGPSGTQLKEAEFANNGVKIYGQENVSNDDFEIGNRFLKSNEFSEFESVEILPSDILVTMMGTVGDSTTFPEETETGIMDSHLLRIRTDRGLVCPEYLSLLIDGSKLVEDQIQALSHGLVMSGLNIGIVESITVPIPEVEEQKEIVAIINGIDKKIENESQRLECLTELKRGLMQDLLTGKVRVNNLQLPKD